MKQPDQHGLTVRAPTRRSPEDEAKAAYRQALQAAGNRLGLYDYVGDINRFRHRISGDLLTETAVINLLGHTIPEKMSFAKALYSDALEVRQYARMTFIPGEGEHVIRNGQLELNTWRPTMIVAKAGDPALFLHLVNHVFDGDPIAAGFFLKAIASLVQKPSTKWGFMILIIGAQGIGKSLLLEVVAVLVGKHNAVFPTIDALRGTFTGWLANAYVALFHEMERMGREAATRLKSWITSETLLINQKNVPEYQIQNVINVMGCANHDDVALLDPDDRRTFTWISQAQKQPPEYYQVFCDWFFQGDGAAIVLDYLLQRDLSDFNPKAAPPKTVGRERLIANSRSEAAAFLQEALDSEAPPFVSDLCTANELLQYLRSHQVRCSYAEVMRFLRDAGAISLGQRRVRGTRPNLWAVRHQARWETASGDDIANAYVPAFDQATLLRERADHERHSAVMPTRKHLKVVNTMTDSETL